MAREINLGSVIGPKGDPGVDGKSAYEYALEGGYPGSEQDFYNVLGKLNSSEPSPPPITDDDSDVYGFDEYLDILSPSERIKYIGLNEHYTPITTNLYNHSIDYGSWNNFPTLVENKPYMVYEDGTIAYELLENNYDYKSDGFTSSEIGEKYTNKDAFSKFIKIYVRRWTTTKNGNNIRKVRFSYEPKDGYKPLGFIDNDGREMPYVWLPMFYAYCYMEYDGVEYIYRIKSVGYSEVTTSYTIEKMCAAIERKSDRAVFFGGPIIDTIVDLLYMWFKTTDIKSVCGKGNTSGNSRVYNSVLGGGKFYGSIYDDGFNKILHSVVLGSYNPLLVDPYMILNPTKQNNIMVSTNYSLDLTGESYNMMAVPFLNTDLMYSNKSYYYKKLIGSNYCSFPLLENADNDYNTGSTTGYCSALNMNIAGGYVDPIFALRFGGINNTNIGSGIRSITFSPITDKKTCAVMLKPPSTSY